MKKIISIILTILVIMNICSVQVYATTKQELQNQKKETTQKKKEAENEKKEITEDIKEVKTELNQLSDKIYSLESEISDTKNEINSLEVKIQEKQKVLNEKNEDLQEKEDLLKERLVAMYMAGETSYLDFILSGNFMDFMSNYYLVSQIAEYDVDLIEQVENERNQIQTEKNNLESEKEKVKTAKSKLEKKNVELEQSVKNKKAKVSTLTEEQKKVQAEIDKYYEAEKALDAEILKLTRVSKQSNPDLKFTSGVFKWPCPSSSTITSYFGARSSPGGIGSTYHKGIDIGASMGASIIAAADGVVIASTFQSAAGNYVMINHGSGICTVYMHASKLLVSTGQTVKTGQTIALVGSTGNSTGPHLHFGVSVNGSYVNPLGYFNKK